MYNSQYYTCEQIDERLLQGYLDDYNTQTGQSLTKAQFLTKLGSLFSKEGVIDNTATQIGYYECDTAAGTAAKAITVANYALFAGGSMKVKFANKNTANNATLNINSQGAKALYYQGERASATNSWDANEVVEIYYDGTSYYANNVKGGSGSGVYDVSKEHPTSGPNSDGKFTLEYILNSSNVNELIPVNKRYPGMTIQFVSTSDNKYVQFRCMDQNFTTDVTQWQGVDDEPTAGSNNLVKSGGVQKYGSNFGCLVGGTLNVNLTTGVVSVADGSTIDLYYGLKGLYKRFQSGTILTTITGTGTNALLYDLHTDTFVYGANTANSIIVGVCLGKNLLVNGDVEILYSDNKKTYTQYQLSQKSDELKTEVDNIKNDIAVLNSAPDESITEESSGTGELSGNVGSIISKSSSAGYRWKRFQVSQNDEYIIKTLVRASDSMRGIWLVNANDEIVEIVSRAETGSGEICKYVKIPAGVSYIYVNSYTWGGGDYSIYCFSKESLVSFLVKEKLDVSSSIEYGILTGAFDINLTTGVVTTRGAVDIYYKGGASFYRVPDGTDIVTITGTGTNAIVFNIQSKTFSYGSNLSSGVIVAVCVGKRAYFNGNVDIYFSDGTEMASPFKLTSLYNDLLGRINSMDTVPQFVSDAALETYTRIFEYVDSPVSMIGHITDVHTAGNNKYQHVGYLAELNNLFGFTLLVNGGDIGLDTGETEATGIGIIAKTKNCMKNGIWCFCKGNHEIVNYLTDVKLDNAFNAPYLRQFQRGERVLSGSSVGYGYLDDEKNRCRYIYLNTSDGTYYGLSVSQLNWLITCLNSVQENYRVVILTHCSPAPGAADTDNTWIKDVASMIALRGICESFVAKNTGSKTISEDTVTWDFTNSPSTAKLVCMLSGDSHFNKEIQLNGVNYFVRQGYSKCADAKLPEGATTDSINPTTQCLFDVLVVKNDGNAKIFRIGAGGSQRDVAFTY